MPRAEPLQIHRLEVADPAFKLCDQPVPQTFAAGGICFPLRGAAVTQGFVHAARPFGCSSFSTVFL